MHSSNKAEGSKREDANIILLFRTLLRIMHWIADVEKQTSIERIDVVNKSNSAGIKENLHIWRAEGNPLIKDTRLIYGLFNCVYKSFTEESRQIEFDVELANKQYRKKTELFSWPTIEPCFGDEFFFTPDAEIFEIDSKKVNTDSVLDYLVLPENKKENIGEYLKNFLSERERIRNEVNNIMPLPAYESIIAYVESYYALLKEIHFLNGSTADSRIIESGVLEAILNIDSKTLDNVNEQSLNWVQFSCYNPFSLAAIRSILDNIHSYVFNEDFDKWKDIKIVNDELLLVKIFRRLRRYTVINRQIFLIDLYENRSALVAVKVDKLDGIETIKPIRLVEKIYEAYKCYNDDIIKVCIVGALRVNYYLDEYDNSEVNELARELNFIIKQNELAGDGTQNKRKIELKWYLKNILPETDNSGNTDIDDRTSIVFEKYDEWLLNSPRTNEILEENNLVFILDCPDLYFADQFIYDEAKTSLSVKFQQFTYNNNFTDDELNKYLDRRGLLSELQTQLLGKTYSSNSFYYGRMVKRVNETLINNIYGFYQKNKNKNAYVYISSNHGLYGTSLYKQNMTRREKYNGKEFFLMSFRSTENQTKTDEISNDTKIISLTLWQVAKYTNISVRNNFAEHYGIDCERVVSVLRNIYLGFSYDNWQEKIRLFYYLDEGELAKNNFNLSGDMTEKLRGLLTLLLKYAFCNERNMLSVCYRNSICNILYSNSRTTSDILFYHIYKERFEDIESSVISEVIENNDNLVAMLDRMPLSIKEKSIYSKLFYYAEYSTPSTKRESLLEDIGVGTMNLSSVVENAKLSCIALKCLNSKFEKNSVANGKFYENINSFGG